MNKLCYKGVIFTKGILSQEGQDDPLTAVTWGKSANILPDFSCFFSQLTKNIIILFMIGQTIFWCFFVIIWASSDLRLTVKMKNKQLKLC